MDNSRESITNKKRKATYLLYIETGDGEFITEANVGYFRDLNSAVNWVGRYGCPNSNKEIYYFLSRRYVYRIWDSAYLTALDVDSFLESNMKWHYTKDGDLPSGDRDYIICLADTRRGYMLLDYNTYEQCWDDSECDDYYCDTCDVKKWCSLKEIVDSFDV